MDHRTEVREFLTSRRAKITPQQAGLPAYGGNRRVAGLRREEVAMLAGMSIDYYTRLERGNLGGASEGVLESLALALQLDEAERAHLFDLARTTNMGSLSVARARRKSAAQKVRPSLQRVLDAITGAPAWVRNDRLDFLAANRLGMALYSPILNSPAQPANSARFCFLDPAARDYYSSWESVANDIVAVLRTEAGRNPFDSSLTELVGELSTRSEDFRVRWANHNVRFHQSGKKKLHHPVVGELDLTYEAMVLPADPGLTMFVYTAEPNSPTQEALDFLASWAEGPAQESTIPTHS
ncbi:MAG TPA: helix-turn-helix transcriptional regulator [Propionibacteriaceae bacterium]|nr:helix-turn-helix transcriptional regulator [Propionibacteriaceae bacterium]